MYRLGVLIKAIQCSTRLLAKCKKDRVGDACAQCYGKIASAPIRAGALWRDGRAAEGACLENILIFYPFYTATRHQSN
jgi:hypothetical protein